MIAALALRTCALRALQGHTLVGQAVSDSTITPIDDALKSSSSPFIVVSTEDMEKSVQGRSVASGSGKIDLVLEIGVAHFLEVPATNDAEESIQVVIPQTDGGIEISLDLIERQALRALEIGGGTWGDLFRELCPEYGRLISRRGAGADKGVKFAARQVVIECHTIFEPAFGVAPEEGGPYARWLDALEEDAELSALAPAIRATIIGEAIPDWRALGTIVGLTLAEQNALRLGPFIIPGEEPAELNEIDVQPEGYSIEE